MSSLYNFAISVTRGSFGFGSDNNELIDNMILDIVNTGLHSSFKISKHIFPFELILG